MPILTLDDYKDILEKLELKLLLSEDSDSWSYATSHKSSQVVKLYKQGSDDKLQSLYARNMTCMLIANAGLPFEVENISSIEMEEGRLYTMGQRLSGLRLSIVLDQDPATYLSLCWNLVSTLKNVLVPGLQTNFNWAKYISKRVKDAISKHQILLNKNDIAINFAQATQLNNLIASVLGSFNSFSLMHGRFSPAEILVDPQERTKVVGLLNFSEDTVIGDQHLDRATLLFSAELLEDELRRKATTFLRSKLYGLDENIGQIINVYRIYQALMLIENKKYEVWSLRVLRNLQQIMDATYMWRPFTEHKPIMRQFCRWKIRRATEITPKIIARPSMQEVNIIKKLDKIDDAIDVDEDRASQEFATAQGDDRLLAGKCRNAW